MNSTNSSMRSTNILRIEGDVMYHFIVISAVVILLCAVSLSVLIKAPRIAANIRYMCCNIIFYDICFLIAFALSNWIMDNPKWYYFRATQYTVLGQLCAATEFSVERLVAINSPYLYRKYFKETYVKVFILVELLSFTTIIAFILTFNWTPERTMRSCFVEISIYSTLSVICVVCSLKALVILMKTLSSVHIMANGLKNEMRVVTSRRKDILSVFCLLSVLLHMPLMFEIIFRRCKLIPKEHLHTIYVLLLNTTIDPFLYIWRLKECRLQGLKWLSQFPCFKFLENTVEAQRIVLFNIPVAERTVSTAT